MNFFYIESSRPQSPSYPVTRRTQDLTGPYRYRRDNSQDVFEAVPPARPTPQVQAPILAAAQDPSPQRSWLHRAGANLWHMLRSPRSCITKNWPRTPTK